MKRPRIPKQKPGVLEACWGREDRCSNPDFVYVCGEGCHRADLRLLHYHLATKRSTVAMSAPFGVEFEPSLIEELEKRGYDITTIKFSVQKKQP